MQSSLVLLTRCWERPLRYLLLIVTTCHVLGRVNNYWGTHEYQPGRGNVSHFHLLLDCLEDREELAQTVACKLRRFNCEIKQFAGAHSTILNKPRTAKVGAISKAQNLKGGPFGLCETPGGCKKIFKKLKGDPLAT